MLEEASSRLKTGLTIQYEKKGSREPGGGSGGGLGEGGHGRKCHSAALCTDEVALGCSMTSITVSTTMVVPTGPVKKR